MATGAQWAGMVEVTGGLPEGAEVIVSNLHRVSDGTAIAAQPAHGPEPAQ